MLFKPIYRKVTHFAEGGEIVEDIENKIVTLENAIKSNEGVNILPDYMVEDMKKMIDKLREQQKGKSIERVKEQNVVETVSETISKEDKINRIEKTIKLLKNLAKFEKDKGKIDAINLRIKLNEKLLFFLKGK